MTWRLIGSVVLVPLSALLVVAGLVVANTLRTPPVARHATAPRIGARAPDRAAAERLAQAVRFRTVAPLDTDPGGPDAAQTFREFTAFHEFLRTSYPGVDRALTREVISEGSLLYTWPGRDPRAKAVLLAAHLDVVPVSPGTAARWTHPPFAGHIADGYIWGRGTLDDKAAVLGLLEAVERLVAVGVQPTRTVYLAFGHDEEIGGRAGAGQIAARLAERGVRLDTVIDEGSAVTAGLIPGVPVPVALIGIAEKGRATLELSVRGDAGHASIPPPQTAAGRLATAVHRLEAQPMPARLSGPTRELLTAIGPAMPWARRAALANLWLFEPLVARQLTRARATNALARSTLAVTVVRAGHADNVLPADAHALLDVRILPGDSIAGMRRHVARVIDDPRVQVRVVRGTEPSPVSPTRTPAFDALAASIRAVFPDAVVAPALGVTRTDAAHYVPIADSAYRFLPLRLGREDLARIHGVDERLAVDAYADVIDFYSELLRLLVASPGVTRLPMAGGLS
jgi:carboxypeptidase PM20D1